MLCCRQHNIGALQLRISSCIAKNEKSGILCSHLHLEKICIGKLDEESLAALRFEYRIKENERAF